MNGVWIVRAALVAAAICGASAGAQTYTVNAITAVPFGTLAAATTGVTVFDLNASTSAVTVQSGSGAKISGTSTRSTVTIRCANGGGNCNGGSPALVKIAATGSPTGRGDPVTGFSVVSGTGTVGTVTTNGDGSIQFTMTGWTATNQNRTFFLGMDLPIEGDNGAGATGAVTSQFQVGVARSPTVPVGGTTANTTATVRRSLVVAKLSDLAFGTLVRPTTGSGTVIINQTTGARTTGGANPPIVVAASSSGRAAYTITGETGTAFTITVPTTFNMTSGANTLAVTTSATATGAQTLTGGTFSLGVGGTTTIASTTPSGNYTGSFSVTFVYN